MTLNYQATVDDLAEPAIRHFLRSKTARRSRVRSTILGAILMTAAFLFIFRERGTEFLSISAIIGAFLGAAINFWTYIPAVKKRIRNHVRTEHGHKMPCPTTYMIESGVLRCDSLGVTIEFSLADLDQVSEDRDRLELSFGDKGLSIIPLKAFQDDKAKVAFLEAIQTEKAAIVPR